MDMPRRVYADLRAYFKDKTNPSATEIADELGISYAFLSQIKWGERQPRLTLALKIADRCHVPLESLVQPRVKEKAS
jgi:transcriptional regulator with XRE-family HTH domain